MNTTLDTNSDGVWISYFTDKHTDKISSRHLIFMNLFKNIRCEKYAANFKSLLIYIVALPQDAFGEKDKIYHRRKKQQLEIRINADYDRLLQADERETLHIIAETYLKAIEIFLIPRKDFEGKKFYQDVKNLFEKEGILEKCE